MPMEPPLREKIAVLIPTTPPPDHRAPPEVPGLMRRIGLDEEAGISDAEIGRDSAETMPL
jgi:hypothetical protein